jgi:hypothetical protein
MSRNSFRNYFDRVDHILEDCPNLYVETYSAAILSSERANLKLRLCFYFRYLLSISEALIAVDDQVIAIDYRYHFQDEQNNLIFRYDNTPHFPDLPSFPHHKHLPNRVISCQQPNIILVMQDVMEFLKVMI